MKRVLIIFLLLAVTFGVSGQSKKRGKVKRKYRKTEQVGKDLPAAVFHGRVRDIYRHPIAGARVEVEDLKIRVHTNSEGRFLLTNLPPGRQRIRVSFAGYRTKYFDYYLQSGQNSHYIALDQDIIHHESISVIAQKREQQIMDIPSSAIAVTDSFAEQMAVTDFAGISELVPDLFYLDLGSSNSGFSISSPNHGNGFSEAPPSVALLIDQVPVDPLNGFSGELFDAERMELLRGPQNVLYGRGASLGSLHLISRKPGKSLGGYFTTGIGNYKSREVRGAIDIPVAEDILYLRTAGFFRNRNGYIENNPYGNLNGKNCYGGRLSVRLTPAYNHEVNLVVNYQKLDEPGIAYINKWSVYDNDDSNTINTKSFLNNDEFSGSEMELTDATLKYNFFRNEHNYWTSISSFRKTDYFSGGDIDGTDLPALYSEEDGNLIYLYQEVSYNFSRRSRTNGCLGLNYSHESGNRLVNILSNDQHIVDIIKLPGNFLLPTSTPFPVFPNPAGTDPLRAIYLPGQNGEQTSYKKSGWTAAAFLNFTHKLRKRILFTGGIRAEYDSFRLKGKSDHTEGSGSILGTYTGAFPNLFFAPFDQNKTGKSSLSFTGHVAFTFSINESANIFLRASRVSKPRILQFTHTGDPMVTKAEKINSLEAGWKFSVIRRIYLEVSGYYRQHINSHVIRYNTDGDSGLFDDSGRALSYGANAGLRFAVLKGLDLFGNYAWQRSAFDSTDVKGNPYLYAGNCFALSPEHSFNAGLSARIKILPAMNIFFNPFYSWKSYFWFTEANIPGLEQPSYGIFNLNGGLELIEPHVILDLYATNILEEDYYISAGHTGSLAGLPTFVPGPPMIWGARLTYKF